MRFAALVVILAACGHKPPAPAPAPGPVDQTVHGLGVCAYVYQEVMISTGGEGDAYGAFEDGKAADEKGQYLDAAHKFLDCAAKYAAATTDNAAYNAHVCYYDAIYAYVRAGAFAREGKAALTAAAAKDSKNASYIEIEVKKAPPDCTPDEDR